MIASSAFDDLLELCVEGRCPTLGARFPRVLYSPPNVIHGPFRGKHVQDAELRCTRTKSNTAPFRDVFPTRIGPVHPIAVLAMRSLPSYSLQAVLLVALVLGPTHLARAQDQDRQERSVDSFTAVEFAIPGTLHLQVGDTHSVAVAAPESILDRVETTVDGDALEIDAENESDLFDWFENDDLDADQVDIYVTAPTFEKVSLAGSGRIVGETPLKGESLSLAVAGSGDIDVEINTKELTVNVVGSGDCLLRGQTDALRTKTTGSGDIRATDLQTRTAEVRITGSGDVELHAADSLNARILGAGDVRYLGNPTVDVNSLGSGTVRPIE